MNVQAVKEYLGNTLSSYDLLRFREIPISRSRHCQQTRGNEQLQANRRLLRRLCQRQAKVPPDAVTNGQTRSQLRIQRHSSANSTLLPST